MQDFFRVLDDLFRKVNLSIAIALPIAAILLITLDYIFGPFLR